MSRRGTTGSVGMSKAEDQRTLRTALQLHQAGQLDEAANLYRLVLQQDSGNPQALHYLGVLEASVGNLERAKSLLARSLAPQPANVQFVENYATILVQAGDYEAASLTCRQQLQLEANNVLLLYIDAVALFRLERLEEALAQFDKLLSICPDHVAALNERGSVLARLRQFDAALVWVQRALALQPRYADAHLNLGNLYAALKRYDEAFCSYDRALALKPDLAEAWLGRGNILRDLERHDGALAAYKKALTLNPGLAQAWFGHACVLFNLGHYAELIPDCGRALALKPNLDRAAGVRLLSKLYICDWNKLQEEVEQLLAATRQGKLVSDPFTLLSISSSTAEQLQSAKLYVQDQTDFVPLWRGEIYSHKRIRLAYLSADFGEHPVAYLTAGLFEHHDRSRFELTAISFGAKSGASIGQRIQRAFEQFIEIEDKCDEQIAALIREREIDIVVDLMGYTRGNRVKVLARRPAPLQINYLGFIGTMGAPFIDYVIADEVALPFDQQLYYHEKIVHLPDSFLATDDRQEIAHWTPSREETGLPTSGFVFCCFNNSYKITPHIFEAWMRILRAVPGSVLWLAQSNAEMVANLRREAQHLDINPARLVFAQRLPLPEHLARQRLAGLFLDTVPYNAGATAVGALWSGVPVLTLGGRTFVGRMAASVLHAAALPELVAQNLHEYEALAIKLASEPSLLAGIRKKLAASLPTAPLFDTARFCRNIEAAYLTMMDIHRRGERPRSFAVEPA